MRLDHLLSRELSNESHAVPPSGAAAFLACRPNLADTAIALRDRAHTLLSFERPAAPAPPVRTEMPARLRALSPDLENCTVGQINSGITDRTFASDLDHRQDSKGTRWMPWHQESMKGVDDCDKPR